MILRKFRRWLAKYELESLFANLKESGNNEIEQTIAIIKNFLKKLLTFERDQDNNIYVARLAKLYYWDRMKREGNELD